MQSLRITKHSRIPLLLLTKTSVIYPYLKSESSAYAAFGNQQNNTLCTFRLFSIAASILSKDIWHTNETKNATNVVASDF